MDYIKADSLLTGRNRDSRKLANNTYLVRKGEGQIAIRLHATDILTLREDGGIEVRTGGWQTPTTKARLNDYLPSEARIYQDKGTWFWRNGVPFSEGDIVRVSGETVEIQTQAKPDTLAERKKHLKRINAFAKQCAAAVPLPVPDSGDCLYCQLERNGDNASVDHLDSHLDESYLVPSLVFRALKDAKAGDLVISGAFGKAGDWGNQVAPDYVKRAVSRYLKRRFGYAS